MSVGPLPISDSRFTIGFLRRGYSATGGVEAYLTRLAEGLRGKGHRVILLGTNDWPEEAWPGGEILRCPARPFSSYVREVTRLRESGAVSFDLILSVEKVPGCDLYRTDEGVHLAWMRQRGRFLSPWGSWLQWCMPKHREKLALEKQIYRGCATRRVISLSEKISRDIVELYGYPEEQITMIRNGVPASGIPGDRAREEARRELGLSPDEKCIIFVGTGWERKGLRFAIRAVEALVMEEKQNDCPDPGRKITLLVAGKGPARRYASHVTRFLGPVSEMGKVYAAADLLISPTIFDPFSLAAVEAMSAGVPVIISAAAGVSEIMTPGVHGEVIAEPDDVRGFTSALRKWLGIIGDPERGARARSDCAMLGAEHSLERNLTETLAVIGRVMNEKQELRTSS